MHKSGYITNSSNFVKDQQHSVLLCFLHLSESPVQCIPNTLLCSSAEIGSVEEAMAILLKHKQSGKKKGHKEKKIKKSKDKEKSKKQKKKSKKEKRTAEESSDSD